MDNECIAQPGLHCLWFYMMHSKMADHSVAADIASAAAQAAVAFLCDIDSSMSQAVAFLCDINSSMSQATQADFLQFRCALNGKNEAQLASIGECPLDPGGYFIVRVGLCVWTANPCIKYRLQHRCSMQHSPHMHQSCTGLTSSGRNHQKLMLRGAVHGRRPDRPVVFPSVCGKMCHMYSDCQVS